MYDAELYLPRSGVDLYQECQEMLDPCVMYKTILGSILEWLASLILFLSSTSSASITYLCRTVPYAIGPVLGPEILTCCENLKNTAFT